MLVSGIVSLIVKGCVCQIVGTGDGPQRVTKGWGVSDGRGGEKVRALLT